MERIRREREKRRHSAEHLRRARSEHTALATESGAPATDASFAAMIAEWRASAPEARPRTTACSGDGRIIVAVRKRPLSAREAAARDYDAITCLHPRVVVHAPKLKVDGITRFLDNSAFAFDHAFDERASTQEVYDAAVQPLVGHALERRGRGTVLAYGQTGQSCARSFFCVLSAPPPPLNQHQQIGREHV